MNRRAIGLGVVGLILCLLLLWQDDALPSYLAAWLFWMALPLGALPLVAAGELLGIADGPLRIILRRMLLMLPLGAIFALPLMLHAAPLFQHLPMTPRLAAWLEPSALVTRMIVMLIIWSALGLLLCRLRRGSPRTALVTIALIGHVVLGSVAALDWVMSLAPGLGSSAFGLLMIMAQMVTAASAALFVLALGSPPRQALPGAPGLLLIGLLGIWVFVHFTQYLVIWSANLPPEIIWYQQRGTSVGGVLIWAETAVTVLAIALLATHLRFVPAAAASLSAALLIGQLLQMLWLVTPAFRAGFTLRLVDAVAPIGLGALAAAVLVIVIGSPATRRPVHAPG